MLGRTRTARVASWTMLAVVCAASAGVCFVLTTIRQPVIDMYIQLGSMDKLPWITRLVLAPFSPWAVGVLAIPALAKELLVRDRMLTLEVNAIHAVAVFMAGAAVYEGLILPFFALQ